MTRADFYFARGDMDLAVEAYSLFIENYPRSERLNDARRRLIHAHMASFKGPQFDAAGLYEARELLLRFQATDANCSFWERTGKSAYSISIQRMFPRLR